MKILFIRIPSGAVAERQIAGGQLTAREQCQKPDREGGQPSNALLRVKAAVHGLWTTDNNEIKTDFVAQASQL